MMMSGLLLVRNGKGGASMGVVELVIMVWLPYLFYLPN